MNRLRHPARIFDPSLFMSDDLPMPRHFRSQAHQKSGLALVASLVTVFAQPNILVAVCLNPPGDVSGDQVTSVVDVQCSILMNLWSLAGQEGPLPPCLTTVGSPSVIPDHNCDRIINITDTLLAVTFTLTAPLDESIDANANQCVDACETDQDKDGDFDFTDCAPHNSKVYAGAVETCNGKDDNCDGKVDPPTQPSVPKSCDTNTVCDGIETCQTPIGDVGVVITEFMTNPAMVPDEAGEWIELFNGTGKAVNIQGWTLEDQSGEQHQIDAGGALFIAAGGYLLLGPETDKTLNGGLIIYYAYQGFNLDNSVDSIILRNKSGLLVDRVDYGPSFPLQAGVSTAKKDPSLDGKLASSWVLGVASTPSGDKGTPFGPNDDVLAPTCIFGTPLSCGDSNECTTDSCDPVLGCKNTPFIGPCDDGTVCTVGEQCSNGVCGGGANIVCKDAVDCTVDSCDPVTGCKAVPSNAICADGEGCTIDTCDANLGCQYVKLPEGAPCDDGYFCSTNETCKGGICKGEGFNCDDGNPCTSDSCINANDFGCLHQNLSGLICDDNNPCTFPDNCQSGTCTGPAIAAPGCPDPPGPPVLCHLFGNAGETKSCFLLLARTQILDPGAASLTLQLQFDSQKVVIQNFYDASKYLTGIGSSPMSTGHVVTLSPAPLSVWNEYFCSVVQPCPDGLPCLGGQCPSYKGKGGITLTHPTNPAALITDAVDDGAGDIVGDPLFIEARFILLTTISAALPTTLKLTGCQPKTGTGVALQCTASDQIIWTSF